MADDDTDGVIPESKIREAHAKCMEDPQLAKYFNDAPQGAKEYIALMFYCTVFQNEVDDGLYATYQKEVEEEMSREDLLYLATHDRNPQSKAHFRELLAKMPQTSSAAVTPRSFEFPEIPMVQESAPSVKLDTRRIELAIERLQASVTSIQTYLEDREKREAKRAKVHMICRIVLFVLVTLACMAALTTININI